MYAGKSNQKIYHFELTIHDKILQKYAYSFCSLSEFRLLFTKLVSIRDKAKHKFDS